MSSRIFSLTLKVIKFSLILLLLGLGVHFGLLAPRGDSSLDYAGNFGSSYRLVVVVTIVLYFLYRIMVALAKSRLGSQEGIMDQEVGKNPSQSFEMDAFGSDEIRLFILVVSPIVVGMALTQSTIDLANSTFFHVLRFIIIFVILGSVSKIYNEKVEFPKVEESDSEQPA